MKRLLILGFILVLLLAIPLTLFLLGQQTKTRSGASPATHLAFVPANKTVNIGSPFSIDISLDPGVQSGTPNNISFINLLISYPTNLNLDTTKGDSNTGMTIHKINGNDLVILVPPSSPQCGAATCTITVSLGVNPQQEITTIAPSFITLYFIAQSASEDNQAGTLSLEGSKVLSTGANDQPTNNVLLPPDSASIIVVAPSTTPSPSVTGAVTDTPTGTQGGTGGVTNTPTETPTGTITGTISPTGTSSATPTCVSLAADTLSGPAPLTVQFTATGNDDQGRVNKITFNFGDGKVQDVTSGGGVGSTVANTQLSHTYSTEGTFTAGATITDDGGGVSDPSTCQKTITIGNGGSPTSIATATPTPPIPSSGPGQTIVNIGLIGGILSVLGAILLFAL